MRKKVEKCFLKKILAICHLLQYYFLSFKLQDARTLKELKSYTYKCIGERE